MFASLWSLSIQAPKTAFTTVRTAVSYWWAGKVVFYCCYLLALTDIRSVSQHADVWFKVSERVSLLPLEMTYTPSVLSACLCICCICCMHLLHWIMSVNQQWSTFLHEMTVCLRGYTVALFLLKLNWNDFKARTHKRDQEQLQMVDKGNSPCILKVTANVSGLLFTILPSQFYVLN